MRLLLLSTIAFTALLRAGVLQQRSQDPKAASEAIGEVELYTFSASCQDFSGKAQPLSLPCSTSLPDTFVILGQKLATIYLAKTYNGMATDIRFEIAKVEEIRIPLHKLRIAVVNMVEEEEDALRYFFEGSACSQASLYRLTAMFFQPQLNPPFLDGLVLLYNGNLLSELDHISLAGILTPRLPLQVAERAIHRAKRKALVNHNNRRAFPVPTS